MVSMSRMTARSLSDDHRRPFSERWPYSSSFVPSVAMRRCFFMPMTGMMPPAAPYRNSHCHGPAALGNARPLICPHSRVTERTTNATSHAREHRHMRAHRRGQAGRAARGVVAVDHHVLDADEPGDVHGLLVARVLEDRVDVPPARPASAIAAREAATASGCPSMPLSRRIFEYPTPTMADLLTQSAPAWTQATLQPL